MSAMVEDELARAMGRLASLVDWERRSRSGMRPGLEPVRDLCARLGEPQRRLRCVHVTGSKGKGTTAAIVAAALRKAGRKVGLYTSPHVERVEERLRIDGAEVESRTLGRALERAHDARDAAVREATPADDATWFDVVTAACLLAMAEAGCEWAVVEVGLGGRLDSTNIVHGEVAVVVNVELEHRDVLGPTRACIAREKGGIVKQGATLVTSLDDDDEAGAVLRAIAVELGARRVVVPPLGTWRERNADLARAVLAALGERDAELGPGLVDEGVLHEARLPARGEWRQLDGVPILLDGVHVPAAVELAFADVVRARGKAAAVVLALGRDKDLGGVLKALRAASDLLLCTSVASGPLRGAEELCEAALAAGWNARAVPDPLEALRQAAASAGPRGWACVAGSFHLAGVARRATGSLDAKDPSCSPSSPMCS
jgi:dihydrofolate synthase/folylpolyglutamate synthase